MALAATSTHNAFLVTLHHAEETACTGVVPSTRAATDRSWAMWTDFCCDLVIDLLHMGVDNPIAVLQVYANCVHDGTQSKSGQPVWAGTVDTALRDVGQTCALMGSVDPCLDSWGQIDLRLSRQLRGYHRADPPPSHVKPIPLALLQYAAATTRAETAPTSLVSACCDMIIIGFFFLMRSGKYT